MESSTPLLTRVVQRDFDTLKLHFQRMEAPHVFWGVRNALHRVRGNSLARRRSEGVSFSTIPAPLLADQQPRHLARRARQTLNKSDFVLRRVTAVRAPVTASFNVLHKGGSCRGVLNMHAEDEEEEDDGLEDEEDEEDDAYEDDDVSVLSWQMLGSGSPVRAEPVTDTDEQLQFDTIAAGNVPTMFLGRAYTNGPVNLMALHKMQNLLEDMYYHLICPHRDEASRSTVDLLLRLCWMPHPSPQQNGANMYPDVSTALLERGLDLTADDLALKSIADKHAAQNPHSPQNSTGDSKILHEDRHRTYHTDSDRDGLQLRPSDSTRASSQHGLPEPPRIAALAAQLPSEGLQTLFDCCSRVSSILLSLSSVVQDTPASTSKPKSSTSKHTDSDEHSPIKVSKSASQNSADDDAACSAVSEVEHSSADQPAAASDAGGSVTLDENGAVCDVPESGAAAAPADSRDRADKLQSHGRNANMRRMAEHLLKDRDRDSMKESSQQGGAESDARNWSPLWRNQKKQKASTGQVASQDNLDPNHSMHNASMHSPGQHEADSQLSSDPERECSPLDSSVGSANVTAAAAAEAEPQAEVDVSGKSSRDREDEDKSAAAVAAAVAAAEAVSQRVRDAAAKLSDVIDQMSRLLLPTPIPLGLAVLFSQTLPSYVGLAAASADQTALSNFCASAAGRSFRKHFDANIAACREQRAQRRSRFLQSSEDLNAADSDTDPLNSALSRMSGAAASSCKEKRVQAGARSGAEAGGRGNRRSSPSQGAPDTPDESLAPQLLAGNDSNLHKLPVFFVPGAKILLPVQGHAVQFWPIFLSRAHLMTWVHRAHEAMSLAWLARRRRDRQRGKRIIQARAARFFLWCRTSRGPGDGMAGGGLGGDSDGLDDNMPEATEEPSEVQDLMNELSEGVGVGDGDKSTVVISIGPSGFGKSVELVALGAISLVCGAAESAAGAVDSAVVALWGMRSLLGLKPKFSVQACSLGEAAEAARAWNSEATVAVKDAMHGRWDMLQREVDEIIAALAKALQDEVGTSEGPTTIQLTVTPGSNASASRGPFFMRRLLQHITRRGAAFPTDTSTPTEAAAAPELSSSSDSSSEGRVDEGSGGSQPVQANPGRVATRVGAESRNELGTNGGNTAAQQSGGDASHSHSGSDSTSDPGSASRRGAMEWTGGTEGSRRFWRRRREAPDTGSGCKEQNADAGSAGSAINTDNAQADTSRSAESDQHGDTVMASVENTTTTNSSSQTTQQQQQQNDTEVRSEGSAGGKAKQAATDTDVDVASASGGERRGKARVEDSILPRSVSEPLRQVITHLLGGSSSVQTKAMGSGAEGGSPDSALMDSLRSGAEAGVGQSRINQEGATALAAAGAAESAPPLRERLADFLSLAVAERHALVENMLAAQRNVDRGDVPPATVRELRRAERDSRVQLMHSLLAMGQELAAATSESDAAALRTTWITSVNSLLAIDQASGLSPLLPLSASSQHHVQQLRTAPAALNFLLSAATSLHGAARRNPQALSLLLEPASALFEIHRSLSLHQLAQQQQQDEAAAGPLGAFPGPSRPPRAQYHAPRYQVHSSRGLVPPPKAPQSHQQPSDASNSASADSKSEIGNHPVAPEGVQAKEADAQQGDASLGGRVVVGAHRMHGVNAVYPRWRFVLDALMPLVSQLDSHNSVALELDVDQLLGITPPEMLMPQLATITSAAPPFDTPEFRGLLLVGDVSVDSAKQQSSRHGGVSSRGMTPEINFGYIPAVSEQPGQPPIS